MQTVEQFQSDIVRMLGWPGCKSIQVPQAEPVLQAVANLRHMGLVNFDPATSKVWLKATNKKSRKSGGTQRSKYSQKQKD